MVILTIILVQVLCCHSITKITRNDINGAMFVTIVPEDKDISKEFDSVNWSFLLDILAQMGFSRRWLNWISLILSTASTRIICNGSPGRRICHARGLRQGDLLSPLLFVLVMEALNALFRLADGKGLLEHLDPLIKERLFVYADDVIVLLPHGNKTLC